MVSVAELTLLLSGKDQTSKMLKDVGTNADGLGSKLGGLQGTMSTLATVAGGVLAAGAIQKLAGGLYGAANAAAEDEAATARLDQALRLAGGAFDANKKKVDDRIASMQKLAFSDDDVRDSFQTLLAATGDVDESLRRQALAADVARGANIPLQKASLLLGKVTAENVEQFKRMGITIGEGASEAEAFAALQAKFGGQAEQYARSTAGQFERAQIQMAELKESIGAALLPVLTTLATVLTETVAPAMEGVFGFVMDHKEELAAAFAGFAAVVMVALVPAFTAWAATAGAAAAATIIALAPVLAVGLAVGALAVGVVLLIRHWDEITAKFPILGTAADGVRAKFAAFVGWLQSTLFPAILEIAEKVKAGAEKAVGFIKQHWGTIEAILKGYFKVWGVVIETAWKQIQTTFETALGVIKGVVDVFMGVFTGDWSRAWGGVKQIVESVWTGIKGTIENAIGLIKGLAPLMLDAGQALIGAFFNGMKAAGGSLMEVIQAIGKGIANGVIDVINSAISAINNSIPDKISLPGLPDIDLPDNPIGTIPHLARGGIVTRPTLALIGEAGPEAVVPLSRGREGVVGGNTYITIEGSVYGVDDLVRTIDRALKRGGQSGLVPA